MVVELVVGNAFRDSLPAAKIISLVVIPRNSDRFQLTELLHLKVTHTANVTRVVSAAKGRYHHHAGLFLSISMFIPKRL